MTRTTATTATPGALPERALKELSTFGWTVVPDYHKDWQTVAKDLQELRSCCCSGDTTTNNYFTIAKIGTEIQDANLPFRDIRRSETCVLKRPMVVFTASENNEEKKQQEETKMKQEETELPESPARSQLFEVLKGLKHNLLSSQKDSKDDEEEEEVLEEVLYVYYPVGGYYKRHVDAERGTLSNWRQYSFLLYLTDMDAKDGGQLRLYRDSGTQELPAGELPNFVDVSPKGGKLVIFRSDLVPHEVLCTHKERCAVVGWFLARPSSSSNNNNNNNNMAAAECRWIPTIDTLTLEALRALRRAVPSIHDKLEPKTAVIDSSSGLLGGGNDWGIVMDAPPPPPVQTAPAKREFPDTDPRYWKSIATFNEQGHVVTLGLGGQRLCKLQDSTLLTNLIMGTTALTTLDLANTDLKAEIVLDLLNRVSPSVTQLYLGGNGLGMVGVLEQVLVPPLPNLTVLDLRYNDLGRGNNNNDDDTAMTALSQFLQTSRVEKLYLEGNALGDSGVARLVTASSNGNITTLRELYLGQNNIGPAGAISLAKHLGVLQKLYLEGNLIGMTGAKAFLEVLPNGRLEKLYVDNNGIPKEESLALGAAVNSVTMIGTGGLFQE